MIKGKDLINKIKEKNFKDEVLEKLEELEIEEKKYIWDRIHSDVEVFIINKDGGIEKSTGGSEYSEDVIIENNNEYVREDFAKYEKIKRKYEYQLRKATTKAWEEYSEDINWHNGNQGKYYLSSNYNTNGLEVTCCSFYKYLPDYYYFPTQENCEKFIKENKELINKFFNLKEEI